MQHVGGELEQAINFNVACYEKYCIHKEKKKCTDVFKVTRHIKIMTTKIAG